MRGKSLFEASFETWPRAALSGRGLGKLASLHCSGLCKIADNAERGDTVEAVRSLVRDINYEDWLYETSASPKAAEMRMKNVSDLYSWIVADLRR